MNAEKTPEEQLTDILANEMNRIMHSKRGSGATVDDPCRLGVMHALLAPMVEKSLVSVVYGKENIEWFDAGRKYHKNDATCEQRVRLGVRVKPTWAQPGRTYSMFFDISELTHEAPISDVVKELLMKGALQMPLRDITLVSRFPLIEVRAKNATEAARIIASHLRAAEAEGWKTGGARALEDNWRNEYDLSRGTEKTVMQFDMRPCLLSDSPLNLTALTLLATNPQFEKTLRDFDDSAQPGRSSDRTSTGVARHHPANRAGDSLSDNTIEKLAFLLVPVVILFSVFSALALTKLLHSPLAGVITFFAALFVWLRIFAWLTTAMAHKFRRRRK